MGKLILGSLGCFALVYGVAFAVPQQTVGEPAPIQLPAPDSLAPRAADPVPPSLDDPYNSSVLPGAADSSRYARRSLPASPHVVAPPAPSAPGAFTVITNGDSEILLDTRNGASWLLGKSNDGNKWLSIERVQEKDVHTFHDPRDLEAPEDGVSVNDADLPAFQMRALQDLAKKQVAGAHQQREQAEEKLAKALKMNGEMKKINQELSRELAELKHKLGEAESQPRVSAEPMVVKPGPLSE